MSIIPVMAKLFTFLTVKKTKNKIIDQVKTNGEWYSVPYIPQKKLKEWTIFLLKLTTPSLTLFN